MIPRASALVALAVVALAPSAAGYTLALPDEMPPGERAWLDRVLPPIEAASLARFGGPPPNLTIVASANGAHVAEAYFALEGIEARPEGAAALYAPWNRSVRVVAAQESILIVFTDAWRDGAVDKESVLAHEYFHTLQYSRSGPVAKSQSRGEMGAGGPAWLGEGSAQYAQWKIPADAGFKCGRIEELRMRTVAASTDVSLTALRTKEDFDAAGTDEAYAVGALAAEALVAHAGEASLLEFNARLAGNASWEDAFRAAFGIDVREFETEFDAARPDAPPEGSYRSECAGWILRERVPGPGVPAVVATVVAALLLARAGRRRNA